MLPPQEFLFFSMGAKWTRLILQEESVKETPSPHISPYYVWNILVSLLKENALLKGGPH